MKYLRFLPLFLLIFLGSCSEQEIADSIEPPRDYGKEYNNKYKRLFNSLYIRMALDRERNSQALNLFMRDMRDIRDIKLYEKVSRLAIDQYRYKDAQAISKHWNKIQKSSESIKLGLIASLESNDLESAEFFYNQYIDFNQVETKVDYSRLFFYFLENKNRLNVINFLSEKFKLNPSQEFALSFVELLYSYNMPIQTIELIEQIDNLNERNLVRLYANSHILINQPNIAQSILENYLEDKKIIDKQVYIELLEIYLIQKKRKKADNVIKLVLDISPNDEEIIFEVSRILYENKFYDLSEKYLSSIVSMNDKVEFLRGMLDLSKKNYEESISHFERIQDYNFKIPAIINTGTSISKLHGIEKAYDYLTVRQKEINIYNDKIQLLMKKISLLRENKYYDRVYDITSNHLDSHPNDISVLYSRAMASESLGNIDEMERDLLEILNQDKKNTNTLNALGYSLTIHTNRFEDALGYITEAYSYDPGNAAIIDSMSWIYFMKGDYEQAYKYSRIAFMKDKDPEIIEHYCQILLKIGRYKEFNDILTKIKDDSPNEKILIEKLESLKSDAPI